MKAEELLGIQNRVGLTDNLIARNPCIEKGAGVERSLEMRVATPEQVTAVADALASRYRALVLTAAYAGCRWGELAALRQRNLDLLHKRLTVVEQVVEMSDGSLLWCEPKTAAGKRVVNLPGGLVQALDRHIARFVAPDPDGLVFTNERGGVLRARNFRSRHWVPAVRAAGVEGLRFHDLRHVAGTLDGGHRVCRSGRREVAGAHDACVS